MRDLLTGLGLALMIEGILYAAFPGTMRRAILSVSRLPAGVLRMSAFVAICLGLAIVAVARKGLG